MGVKKRNRVSDLDDVVLRGDTADEDSVDGGGPMPEGVEDQLYVSSLCNFVAQITSHDSVISIPVAESPARRRN